MTRTILTFLCSVGLLHLRAAESPLSISIAVPIHTNDRTIYFGDKTKPHFPVIVTNTSTEPVRFWQEWCSWGYNALSFELTDKDGKTWIARKVGRQIWRRNFPDCWTLLPKESLVIDVFFADTEIWEGFPLDREGHPHYYTMRVICSVQAEEDSRKLGVWTGRIVSPAQKYAFQVH